jgi:hypothetical protein
MISQTSILPNVTAADLSGIMGLLTLLGSHESKLAKDYLAQLVAEKEAAIAAAEKAAKDKAEADASMEHAATLHDHTEAELKTAMEEAKAQKEKNDALARELDMRETALIAHEAQHSDLVVEHKDKVTTAEMTLMTRENALLAREKKLAADLEDLNRRQMELDEHLSVLKKAAAV